MSGRGRVSQEPAAHDGRRRQQLPEPVNRGHNRVCMRASMLWTDLRLWADNLKQVARARLSEVVEGQGSHGFCSRSLVVTTMTP